MIDAEGLKEVVSTVFDAGAMLAVSAGVGWGLWPLLGPWSLALAGVLLAALTALSSWLRRPKTIPEPAEVEPEVQPGPQHPGTLHVIGR
jgi:hypothetical protein